MIPSHRKYIPYYKYLFYEKNYVQCQVVLKQWGADVEGVGALNLVSIETDVAVCQQMADMELLKDNRGFLCSFVPLGRCTDAKKIAHHAIFFQSQILPPSLRRCILHGRHQAEHLP
jgi:hypothetical protein